MNEIKDLEQKIAELEKRIKFLYRTMDQQTEMNAKFIESIGNLTTLTKSCSENTIANSESIRILSIMI